MAEQTPCLTGDLRTPGKRRVPQRHMAKLATAAPGSIPSPNYSSRNGATVTGVVIHTAEGPTDADSLGAYFAQAKVQVSSHAGVDDSKRVNYVDPAYEAWTLRNGNPWTDNLEMCGFASWTRAQWLEHMGMIQNAAEWVAERCHARNIPPQQITAADIAAGRRSGYFAHWDYTRGTGDGTHWDVGTSFPWDLFGPMVLAAYNGTPLEDDMTPQQAAQLTAVNNAVADIQVKIGNPKTGLYDQVQALKAQMAALAAAQDPKTLAAEIVAALPSGGVDEAAMETALRNVLGSLKPTS